MFEVFISAFSVALLAELRPDKTLCAGGALVARYPARAVLIGGSAALVAKMVLLAYLGATLYARLPPAWREAPRYVAAFTLLVTAFLLLRGSRRQQSCASAAAGASGPRLTADSGVWRPAAAAFAVMFFAEWFDRSQLLVMSVAAEGVKTSGMSSPLWAGLGGALALIVKEGVGITVGARLRSFIPPRNLRRIASAVCVILALLTFFDDEHSDASERHTGAGQTQPAAVALLSTPLR